MTKRRTPELIRGDAAHRRTEGDYMGILLDTGTLDGWRAVVAEALQAAKDGDAQARNWLAQYLIGRPEGKAPTSLTVVVQQLNGADPVVHRLAKPLIGRENFPNLHQHDDWADSIQSRIASELTEKSNPWQPRQTQQRRALAAI